MLKNNTVEAQVIFTERTKKASRPEGQDAK